MPKRRLAALAAMALLAAVTALALPGAAALGHEKPAKQLFGAAKTPAPLEPAAHGGYARGCLAGAKMLPVDGPAWQAMRLSRNRNWGHPALVSYVERLARDARAKDGWPGLLVGDMAQPRGGPMLTGHKSHQIGLDADIWLMPMPARELSEDEREKISAVSVIKDRKSVDSEVWSGAHVRLLKRAASYDEVARIFVHPAIKKALCAAAGDERGWLRKIRPWWGHHYHFHVRLSCPGNSRGCRNQAPPPAGDGCGKALAWWFTEEPWKPKPKPKKKPPELTLADLPRSCRAVLDSGQQATSK